MTLTDKEFPAREIPSLQVRELTREEVRRIWHERMREDFPRNELKPLRMIEGALDRGEYLPLGASLPTDGADSEAGDRIAAYAFFVTPGDAALFDYLAVRRDLRDKGYGSAFLRSLAPPLARFRTVLLESDDPDFAPDEGERAHRLSRLAFYEKNGLMDTGVRASVFGAAYRILVFPGQTGMPDREDTAKLYKELYRTFLPNPVLERMVRITSTDNKETP